MKVPFQAWSIAGVILMASAACGDTETAAPAGEPTEATAPLGAADSAGDDLLARLNTLEGVHAAEMPSLVPDTRGFMLEIEQPVDHDRPGGEHFKQRFTLLHRSAEAPTVLASTGYALFFTDATFDIELSSLLQGNLLFVEHRFFDPSSPERKDWRDLTIRQAAADHHRIVEALKPLYPAAWASTGVSKGGMTSVYHRRFYPSDVAATVAYVAPQSYSPYDPRYPAFLERVGDAACRQKIVDFQREALKRRERLVPMMVAEGAEQGATFDVFGDPDISFETVVVDFRFVFWQYSGASLCGAIPSKGAGDGEVYAFLRDVGFVSSYSDQAFEFFAPYFFQSATQLGGPAPSEGHIRDLVRYPGFNASPNLTPLNVDKPFSPFAMKDIARWVAQRGERLLFVYGENDSWSAGAFEPSRRPDNLRFFAPGGTHRSDIADLTAVDRAKAYDALSAWTGVPVTPPSPAAGVLPGSEDPLARWHELRSRPPRSFVGR